MTNANPTTQKPAGNLIIGCIFGLFLSSTGVFAGGSDLGTSSCVEAIEETGIDIVQEPWSHTSIPKKYFDPIKDLLFEAKIEQWRIHVNSNATKTIIVESANSHDDLADWIILFEFNERVYFKNSVFAKGLAISAKTSEGVNGLYFCGKDGISPEWVWNGMDWK